jgi:hypothetical protein
MNRLIGIIGLAGSGKDTLADQLSRQHHFFKYSFARPLKEALNAVFGWRMEQWEDRVWKETVQPWLGKSPRQCAQTLGTEWGRDLVHPELWVLLAQRTWENLIVDERLLEQYKRMVIPDVRFDNEARWVLEQGGTLIEIRRKAAGSVSAHVSEAGVSQRYPRVVVDNNADIITFLQRAEAALELEHVVADGGR